MEASREGRKDGNGGFRGPMGEGEDGRQRGVFAKGEERESKKGAVTLAPGEDHDARRVAKDVNAWYNLFLLKRVFWKKRERERVCVSIETSQAFKNKMV